MSKKQSKRRKRDRFIETFIVHAAIAGFGALALLGFAFLQHDTFSTLPGEAVSTPKVSEITIEHAAPISIDFTISRRAGSGYLLLQGDKKNPVAISLPALWKVKEVRGVPYDAAKSDAAEQGYTRWRLPAGAGLLMEATDVPDRIEFASPSNATALIAVTSVDLVTSAVRKNTILLQHDSIVELWRDDE